MGCNKEVRMKRIHVPYMTKQRFGTFRMRTDVPFLTDGIRTENPFSLFVFIQRRTSSQFHCNISIKLSTELRILLCRIIDCSNEST